MRTFMILATLIALAAALVAFLMFDGGREIPAYEPLPVPSEEHKPETNAPLEYLHGATRMRPRAGGIYAGRVLTTSDTPIEGATVLLVAYSSGETKSRSPEEDVESINPYAISVIGNNGIAAETRSDGDGHFTLAADAGQLISHAVAYHDGYFLQVLDVRGPEDGTKAGRDNLVFHLQEGGRVKGRVIDDTTKKPVAHALVEINLQSITVPPVEEPGEGERVGTRTWTPEMRPKMSQIPQLVQFIAKYLGERVWGIRYEGGSSLRVYSDKQGRFEIGPLGDEVQIEFVITHPDYAWTDMDRPDGGSRAPRRTIVTPGKTIEREFRLKTGGEISGTVLDEEGNGIPGVSIHARSIEHTPRHIYYVHERPRKAVTDNEGKFRVAGLARGVQNLEALHPAIGIVYEYAVKPGTKDLVITAKRKSAFTARLVGGKRHGGAPVTVHLTLRDDEGGVVRRSTRHTKLRPDQTFALSEIEPGTYEAWCTVERESSQPLTFTVDPMGTAAVSFEMDGGGRVILPLAADGAEVVDPATAQLIRVSGKTTSNASPSNASPSNAMATKLGRFLSREGVIDARGVAPGRYKFRVEALGYVPAESPPFEIEAKREVELEPLRLARYAKVRFTGFVTSEGKRPVGTVILEMKIGNGEFTRVRGLQREIDVPPGPIEVRARIHGTTWKAAHKAQVGSGEVKGIQIVFQNASD